jgi:hydroxymethylglutaryl-CoA reductase (NADPH)
MAINSFANIPMRSVGPIKIISKEVNAEVNVPMATFETPLWPSTSRGAKVSCLAGGIHAVVIDECMTRSVVVEATSVEAAYELMQNLQQRETEIAAVIATTSRFAKFKDLNYQIIGSLVYIRLAITTGDASGHNMVTAAAEKMLNWILNEYPQLRYISISANFCTDKKVSAVNAILGRGKYVVAELLVSREICRTVLRSTPEKIVELHIKKNLMGTMLAGGLRSANAHFANMLLAVYLATGQDAANIIEGSQGIVHAEVRGEDLYFSVSLTNLIVGTVGNGKDLDFTKHNLAVLGCYKEIEPGHGARRLAIIIAATVLCGELSLLAAQTNPGELMRTHVTMERTNKQHDTIANSTSPSEINYFG